MEISRRGGAQRQEKTDTELKSNITRTGRERNSILDQRKQTSTWQFFNELNVEGTR